MTALSPYHFTLLGQMAIAVLLCASYGMLLGQGGLLSFGHALHFGCGAYVAIYAMHVQWGLGWLLLMPMLAGAGGAASAALMGLLATRGRGAHTGFAMITLGLGELMSTAAQMGTSVFGGDGGIGANRVIADASFWRFEAPWQIVTLILFVVGACLWGIHLWRQSAAAQLLMAAREQALRLATLGFDPRRVRFQAHVVAGFFAGVAGGLSALLFEIVTPDAFSSARSAQILLFTFLGGSASLWGAGISGVLMVICQHVLPQFTSVGGLFVALLFLGMVWWAPKGLACR